jgi:hypothetical protein
MYPAVSDPLDRSVYGITLADPTGTIFGGYRTDRATTPDVAANGSYELDKDRPNTTYHYHGTLRTGMPWVAATAIGPSDKITIFYDTSPYPGTTVEVAVIADDLLRSAAVLVSAPGRDRGRAAAVRGKHERAREHAVEHQRLEASQTVEATLQREEPS